MSEPCPTCHGVRPEDSDGTTMTFRIPVGIPNEERAKVAAAITEDLLRTAGLYLELALLAKESAGV